MVIVSVDIIHLNFAHISDYMSHVGEHPKHMAAAGGKHHGTYMVAAGGSHEIVIVSSWESVAARKAGQVKLMASAEYRSLVADAAKGVLHAENFLCFPNPKFPMDHFDGDKVARIRIYNVAPGTNAVERYPAILEAVKERFNLDAHCQAVLHPFVFPKAYGVIAFFADGDEPMEASLMKLAKAVSDPANAELAGQVASSFMVQSNKLLTKVTPDIINFYKH